MIFVGLLIASIPDRNLSMMNLFRIQSLFSSNSKYVLLLIVKVFQKRYFMIDCKVSQLYCQMLFLSFPVVFLSLRHYC